MAVTFESVLKCDLLNWNRLVLYCGAWCCLLCCTTLPLLLWMEFIEAAVQWKWLYNMALICTLVFPVFWNESYTVLQIRNNTLLLVWGSFAIHVLVILKLTTEHETKQTSVKEKDMLSLTWRTCVLSQAILFHLLASGFFRINWFHISTLLMQAVIQIFLRECKISWIFALALRFYFWRDERRPRRSLGFDRRGLHFLTKWTEMSF